MSAAESKVLLRLVEGLPPRGEPFAWKASPAQPGAAGKAETSAGAAGDVSDDDLAILLSAARVAPSADNAQIWRFVTVRDEGRRRALGEAAKEPLVESFADASVVIVACGVRFIVTRARKEQPFAMVDVPIALLHVLLQASEMGLSCCWTLDCDEARVRETLGIPEDARVVAMVALAGRP